MERSDSFRFGFVFGTDFRACEMREAHGVARAAVARATHGEYERSDGCHKRTEEPNLGGYAPRA